MTEIGSRLAPKNEPGYGLGIGLIVVLVVLLIAAISTRTEHGTIESGLESVLLGIYIASWGFMFLASYFFSHKTFFFRALIWICEKFSYPSGRKMAFFYFLLAVFLGGFATLDGLGFL